jgi:DNA topoisomerase-1
MVCYRRHKNTFTRKVGGAPETDTQKLKALRAIRIPASYTDISICYNWYNDTWKATGVDSTGKVQYFYSSEHQQKSNHNKMIELLALGQHLPQIIREIERLLDTHDPYQRVLDALALKIIMLCNFRIGNDIHHKENQTHGVTTLLPEHAYFANKKLVFNFVGKKQQTNHSAIDDPQVIWWIKFLKRRRSVEQKSNLHQYLLSYGGYRVTPQSVNRFLQDFDAKLTAKVWRTWFANIYFINKLRCVNQSNIPETEKERRATVKQVVAEMATRMHHSPEINRQSYLIKDLPQMYIQAPETWRQLSSVTKDSRDFLLQFLMYHVNGKK